MRKALQQPAARGETTPSPVKGLNTVKNFSELDPEEAAILDNFYPQIGRVKLRKGSQYHAYSEVELSTEDGENLITEGSEELLTEGPNDSALLTLIPYSAGLTKKLFAASISDIFDATTAGTLGAAVQSSLTSGQWSYTMFATSGGNFLFLVNGADNPRHFDGTNWVEPTITGITVTELETVTAHKRRLWFTRVNSLSAYYLGSESIAGALTAFNLAPVFSRGGKLVAIGTWTLDAGDGLDDYAVFVTSEGEVAIYQGTDPSSANTWALTGVFRIGRPIGKRCLQKLGPELVVLTEDGFGELSQMIGRARTEDARLSRKIMPSIVADARNRMNDFGWQWCFYPRENMLLVNVPGYASGKQFVMNSEILSWCTFSGWPANAFEVFDGDLYFCAGTSVYKADVGTHDYGNAITGDVKTGSSYFRQRGRQKQFTMIRPILETTGNPRPQIAVLPDFQNAELQTPELTLGGAGPAWDQTAWDQSRWGSDETVQAEWYVVDGIGYCAALRMKISTKTASIGWIATDWLYVSGGHV